MLGAYLQSTLLRLDGWSNAITGLGTDLLDKTAAALFSRTNQQFSDEYLGGLYEEDGLARRICEKTPDEMLRAGYDLSMGEADNAQELVTALRDKLSDLEADARIKDGLVFERVYGGSAVFIGAVDGSKDPAEPLREESLQDITHLTVIDKPLMYAGRWYPATDARAGRPETWWVTPIAQTGAATIEVHESRLLIFPGGRVTQRRRIELQGWGQSVLRAVHDVLRDYNMSWAGVSHMLQSANQDVWYMSGYKNAIASGTEKMREFFAARFGMAQMKMGPNRAVLLDKDGEKFERHGSTLTGVPETIQQLGQRVSAVTDMPMTVLFGMSPAGMNATGASDLQIWNTAVAAMQVERLRPQLTRLISLILRCAKGPTAGKEVKGWAIKFRPLKHLDDQEAADLREKQSRTDKNYVEMGAIMPEEVTLSRFRAEGYSTETTVDLDARRTILDAELEREVEQAENPPPEPPPLPPGGAPPNGSPPPQIGPGQTPPPDDSVKLDAFNDDQPRDDSGRWSSGGLAVAARVKSSATGAATKTKEALHAHVKAHVDAAIASGEVTKIEGARLFHHLAVRGNAKSAPKQEPKAEPKPEPKAEPKGATTSEIKGKANGEPITPHDLAKWSEKAGPIKEGHDKSFISDVHAAASQSGEVNMTLSEFKTAIVHRADTRAMLARIDLVGAHDPAKLRASETPNTPGGSGDEFGGSVVHAVLPSRLRK